MRPNRIWNRPQNTAARAMLTSTADMLPPLEAKAPLTNVAVMTVMGPVGPLIWL